MDMKKLAQKLRHAADVLDELVAETTKAIEPAHAIRRSMRQMRRKTQPKAKARKNGHGYKNGVHWAQTAEGRRKMSEFAKARNKRQARKAS